MLVFFKIFWLVFIMRIGMLLQCYWIILQLRWKLSRAGMNYIEEIIAVLVTKEIVSFILLFRFQLFLYIFKYIFNNVHPIVKKKTPEVA